MEVVINLILIKQQRLGIFCLGAWVIIKDIICRFRY